MSNAIAREVLLFSSITCSFDVHKVFTFANTEVATGFSLKNDDVFQFVSNIIDIMAISFLCDNSTNINSSVLPWSILKC